LLQTTVCTCTPEIGDSRVGIFSARSTLRPARGVNQAKCLVTPTRREHLTVSRVAKCERVPKQVPRIAKRETSCGRAVGCGSRPAAVSSMKVDFVCCAPNRPPIRGRKDGQRQGPSMVDHRSARARDKTLNLLAQVTTAGLPRMATRHRLCGSLGSSARFRCRLGCRLEATHVRTGAHRNRP
jgi:hypothetical protein